MLAAEHDLLFEELFDDISVEASVLERIPMDVFQNRYAPVFVCKSRRTTVLGEGSEGRVEAFQESASGDMVAIKWFKRTIHGTDEIEMLDKLAQIPHKNIARALCAITNSGHATGLVYPHMADDLWKLWKRHLGLLPMSSVAALIYDLLRAVSHLHKHNVVHRDIKPQNILVDWPGSACRAKLADWGWARGLTPDTAQALTPGAATMPYRAPEIELGMPFYGLPMDIWSVGIVLYEMVSGCRFAPAAHVSKRPKDQLLVLISRMVGPINESTWPGVSSFPHWRAHVATLDTAASASATGASSPWEASRRVVLPSARALADALLRLQPSQRVKAQDAVAYKFCSGAAPARAARTMDQCDADTQTDTATADFMLAGAPKPAATTPTAALAEPTPSPAAAAAQSSATPGPAAAASVAALAQPATAAAAAQGGGAPELVAAAPVAALANPAPAPTAAATQGGGAPGPSAAAPAPGPAPSTIKPSAAKGAPLAAMAHAWSQPRIRIRNKISQALLKTIEMTRRDGRPPKRSAPDRSLPPPKKLKKRDRARRPVAAAAPEAAQAALAEPAPLPAAAAAPGGGAPEPAAAAPVAALEEPAPCPAAGAPGLVAAAPAAALAEPALAPAAAAARDGGAPGPAAAAPRPKDGQLCETWTPRRKGPPPEKWTKRSDGQQCACMGFCKIYRTEAHSVGKGIERCRFAAERGRTYCQLCSCQNEGCEGLGCEGPFGTCRKWGHMWNPYPVSLKTVLFYRDSLMKMEPVDLTQFLTESGDIDDLCLLSLLADVWEPLACRRLAAEFRALPQPYKGVDLREAFSRTFESMGGSEAMTSADDLRLTHLKILGIGGVCRHFGLQSLGKRLGLLARDGAAEPVASAKLLKLGTTDKRCRRIQKSVGVLQDMIDIKERWGPKKMQQAWKFCRKGDAKGLGECIGDYVFDPQQPLSLAWGRDRKSYHGLHIVRKIFLKFYHTREPKHWHLAPESLTVVCPDKGNHTIDMPRYLSQREGNLHRAFRPVDPTRVSMWTCLLNLCFKEVAGFSDAFAAGVATAERWEVARAHLQALFGHSPHPKQVATLVVALIDGKKPEDVLMESEWGKLNRRRGNGVAVERQRSLQ